jgi:hypothetical protein
VATASGAGATVGVEASASFLSLPIPSLERMSPKILIVAPYKRGKKDEHLPTKLHNIWLKSKDDSLKIGQSHEYMKFLSRDIG